MSDIFSPEEQLKKRYMGMCGGSDFYSFIFFGYCRRWQGIE